MHGITPSLPTPAPGKRALYVLDGGMGTTLQAPPFNLALDSALWSSELLASQPGRDQLVRLHDTWIEAGADIVQTCTYQSTLPLFLPASDLTSPEAHSTALETMTAALPVAAQSASSASSASGTSQQSRRARVALSLGPYGSALSPGQEYTGAYPPPFGPSETAARDAKPGCSQLALDACPLPLDQVSPSHDADDDEAERYLAAWHLQRLQQFSSSPNWSSEIDLLAFETVPSLTEIRAIRRAMHVFTATSRGTNATAVPFYISLVFPRTSDSDSAVRFPDPALAHLATLEDQMPLLVQVALGSLGSGSEYARPGGIGFNCTSPLHAKRVVDLVSRQVALLLARSEPDPDSSSEKPWLFVYPDGGAVYDVVSRSWHHPTGLTDSSWAALVADAVADAVPAAATASEAGGAATGPWAGVVVGGCCKAGPSAIKALRQEVEKRQWR